MHEVDHKVLAALTKHREESEKAGAFSGPDQEIPVIMKALAAADPREVAIAFHNHLNRLLRSTALDPEAFPVTHEQAADIEKAPKITKKRGK